MKRNLIFALAAALASVTASPAFAEPFMGNVSTFAFGYCPKNWLPADGRTLQIQQYTALYSLYLTKYGGNGTTNFALPTVSVLTAPGSGGARKLTTCVAVNGVFPSRP